jgi:plasmid stabilization system protein ParE
VKNLKDILQMKLKIKWPENAVSNLKNLIENIEKINPSLTKKIVSTIFNKIKLLINFPALGIMPYNYQSAQKKVEYLVNKIEIPDTDLELRELIAAGFFILYCFNNEVKVILFIKHQAQTDYFHKCY